jgi:hypothetical protein
MNSNFESKICKFLVNIFVFTEPYRTGVLGRKKKNILEENDALAHD